ncbi:DegT/DnrJ/EryC1/StrS family aminotransferase [Microterricola viridarii]|uniref:dTDP-4-amino-4,6-dideoxygalactose transaminase n=1 Tax=Microterricola viridarii TaxID=412690 RepID=A0A1H1P7Q8_9MICO|nr:DegT/DnrJ/EryC1/StrS family aminotransferase [Microterricola viridarii]SDS07232.1 dTDP-4-amino-4,6-dideoxygalactose transaminase [Microterricola viridarii]
MNGELTRVPMLDLAWQSAQIAQAVQTGFERVIAASAFIQGPDVAEFEREFAEYCGTGHVIGVANGTDALELALRAAGVGGGDEVIVPANSFVATAEAVLRAGARPVFADCDDNYLLDPASVAGALNPRTRAIAAVHLYGQAAPVEQLRALVGDDVVLLEDAAQAQGATRLGRRAGALGDVAGTSFYPGKNLGAYGDAGAVMTASDEVAGRVRALANHGGLRKYEHTLPGTNSRLDTLQAVVLRAKLALLDGWNADRRRLAARYDELLAAAERVRTPGTAEGNVHVFHQYVVRVPERDRVVAELNALGIGVGVHYPLPIHQLPAFSAFAPRPGAVPSAEAGAPELMSLPIYPGLSEQQQDAVVDGLLSVLRH